MPPTRHSGRRLYAKILIRAGGFVSSEVGTVLTSSDSMVPAIAVGLDDLQQRVDAQTSQATNHSERIKVRNEVQTLLIRV